MRSVDPSPAESFATSRPDRPYPGLRPFEKTEWAIFFGRERMIDDVIDHLACNWMITIHGPSGTGKSSLVRAGVLPKLARQYQRSGIPWLTCEMRPSGGPLWNLAKEFAELEGAHADLDRIRQIRRLFSQDDATLSSIFSLLRGAAGRRLCILVDQFEELFRFAKETSREEAALFVGLLTREIRAHDDDGTAEPTHVIGAGAAPTNIAGPVRVIITMRSEFLGECTHFAGLAEVINRTQYLVPRMDREALLRAICRPAQLYNGEVSVDLARRLIAQATGLDDELPLIQYGLMLMWHDAAAKVQPSGKTLLDASPLDAAGGLMRMLSTHADGVAEAAPDAERRYAAVQRLFRALTDVNVEGKAIRRPQAFRDLVAVTGTDADTLRAIIDWFRRDGISFLTPYAPAPIVDATPIDIGHESLIRCWDRLSDPQTGWLKREFDDGLIWRSLLVEAKSFERDRRRVLSPATTVERSDWLRDQRLTARWAERYGGNFDLVKSLLTASRRSAERQGSLRYAFFGLLLCIVVAAVAWILTGPSPLTLTSTASTTTQVGQSYSQTNTGVGGTGPYTYSVSDGALPDGTRLDPLTGTVSGTPTTAGAFSYVIKITDSGYQARPKSKEVKGTIAVRAPLTLASTPIPSPTTRVGQFYSQTNTGSGGTMPYNYSVSDGALPAGTRLDPLTGTVSGKPITAGAFSYVIKITDSGYPVETAMSNVVTGTIEPAPLHASPP